MADAKTSRRKANETEMPSENCDALKGPRVARRERQTITSGDKAKRRGKAFLSSSGHQSPSTLSFLLGASGFINAPPGSCETDVSIQRSEALTACWFYGEGRKLGGCISSRGKSFDGSSLVPYRDVCQTKSFKFLISACQTRDCTLLTLGLGYLEKNRE